MLEKDRAMLDRGVMRTSVRAAYRAGLELVDSAYRNRLCRAGDWIRSGVER